LLPVRIGRRTEHKVWHPPTLSEHVIEFNTFLHLLLTSLIIKNIYQALVKARALLTACRSNSLSLNGSKYSVDPTIPIEPPCFSCNKRNNFTKKIKAMQQCILSYNSHSITWKCSRYSFTALACPNIMLCIAMGGSISEFPAEQLPKGGEQWAGGYHPLI